MKNESNSLHIEYFKALFLNIDTEILLFKCFYFGKQFLSKKKLDATCFNLLIKKYLSLFSGKESCWFWSTCAGSNQ